MLLLPTYSVLSRIFLLTSHESPTNYATFHSPSLAISPEDADSIVGNFLENFQYLGSEIDSAITIEGGI